MDVLHNLVKSRKVLRQKIEAIKRGDIDIATNVAKTLKPVTEPLLELVQNSKKGVTSSLSVTTPGTTKKKKKFAFSTIPSKSSKIRTSTPWSRKTKKIRRLTSFSQTDSEKSNDDYDEYEDESTVREEKDDDGDNIVGVYDNSKSDLEAELSGSSSHSRIMRVEEQRHGRLASKYLTAYYANPDITDKRTGLQPTEEGVWRMGSKEVQIKNDQIKIDGTTYQGTPGLFELLTRKLPNQNKYNAGDLETFKTMLVQTNAHRKNHDPTGQIIGSKAVKYTDIIKPMFTSKKGKGVYKKLVENVDYLYYDDPNELVERLKLLSAAREAGNDGVDNEIIEIQNELRERYF